MSKTKTKAKQQIKTNVRKITLFVFLLEEKIAFCSITLIVSYLVFKSLINLEFIFVCGISSVKSSVVSDSLQTHGLQYTSSLWTSPTLGVYSNSCPLSWWCHSTTSSSVVPFSSHLQIIPSIRVFSNETILHIRWPKYWSFNFSISSSSEYSGLSSFRMDCLDLLAVQRTFKSLLQNHISKASIPWCSAFFTVHLSHTYTTTGKTIALTRQTYVG